MPRDLEIVGPMTLRLTVDAPATNDSCLFGVLRKFTAAVEAPFKGSFGFPLAISENARLDAGVTL